NLSVVGAASCQVCRRNRYTHSPSAHDAKRVGPKTRYQKSASETEAWNGDDKAQSETRRPGGIRRMPAFRADFREPPVDNGGDQTGWLGRQDSNLGMAESKSAALPLGYAPIRTNSSARDDSGGTPGDQRPRLPGSDRDAITRAASECSAAW